MTTFSVPMREHDGRFFSFSVEAGAVLFAGGRDRTVPYQVCSDLIKAFRGLGFAFMTGCASGVDESFRKALFLTGNKDVSLVACAFRERQKRIKEIYSLFVVPDGLPPKLHLQNGHYGLPVNAVCSCSSPLIRLAGVRLLPSSLQFITANLYLLYQK